MKIAVVGSGVSGLTAAWLLRGEHEVVVFESGGRPGGHARTVEVMEYGAPFGVDTGFIVYNERTYPNFIKLLHRLGIESQPTEMSFSVRCDETGLEYNGHSIRSLFAQPRNMVSPPFLRMLADIGRFNRDARRFLASGGGDGKTLAAFLAHGAYGCRFVSHYLRPMMAAIWSCDPALVMGFPAGPFLRFFENHGLLSIANRPQWRTIKGGSVQYVRRMATELGSGLRLNTPVHEIRRTPDSVRVRTGSGDEEEFDHIILAAHSDQVLRMLVDPSPEERDILGSIPYQANSTVLHRDPRLLPKARRAWASWNYHLPAGGADLATLTYSMNILQRLPVREQYCVTLNALAPPAAATVIDENIFHHPVFSPAAVAAQRRKSEISGVRRTHYCGAYWGYGFHEDGVRSALDAVKFFGKEL